MIRRLHALLLLTAVLLLGACAATTEIVRTVDLQPPAQPARSLIIVGVSTDDALRRRYEEAFAAELVSAGITALTSSALIPSLSGMTMPDVRQHMAAGAGQAEAVLHVQLAGLLPQRTWSPQDIPADARPATREIGGMAVTVNAPPEGSIRGENMIVELEATLYALPDRKLLWSALARTHEANSVEKVARSNARTLLRELRARGLLPAAP